MSAVLDQDDQNTSLNYLRIVKTLEPITLGEKHLFCTKIGVNCTILQCSFQWAFATLYMYVPLL